MTNPDSDSQGRGRKSKVFSVEEERRIAKRYLSSIFLPSISQKFKLTERSMNPVGESI